MTVAALLSYSTRIHLPIDKIGCRRTELCSFKRNSTEYPHTINLFYGKTASGYVNVHLTEKAKPKPPKPPKPPEVKSF